MTLYRTTSSVFLKYVILTNVITIIKPMNERGFRPEEGRAEIKNSSPEEVKAFLTQKMTQGETITVGRGDGSKSTGTIYNIDRTSGIITTSFQDNGQTKYKEANLITFLKWQGMTIDMHEIQKELPEPLDAKEKILSAGGLLALGAISTYATAKLEGLMYPKLLETYNGTNTFFEDMRVFVAHHFQNNPTTTILIGSCIAALGIALKKRGEQQQRSY